MHCTIKNKQVRCFQTIRLYINNSIRSDDGYFTHQLLLLCVPSISKQSHILKIKNEEAKDRQTEGGRKREGQEGREGETQVEKTWNRERKAKKQKVCLSLSSIDAETTDGDDDVMTDWQEVDYLSLNEGIRFTHRRASSMSQHYLSQCSKGANLFLERRLLPKTKRVRNE